MSEIALIDSILKSTLEIAKMGGGNLLIIGGIWYFVFRRNGKKLALTDKNKPKEETHIIKCKEHEVLTKTQKEVGMAIESIRTDFKVHVVHHELIDEKLDVIKNTIKELKEQ